MTFWRETIRTFKTGWKYECVRVQIIIGSNYIFYLCSFRQLFVVERMLNCQSWVCLLNHLSFWQIACDVVCNSMYQCIGFRERKGHAASNKLEDVVNDLILPRRKWIGKFVLNLCLLQVQQNARAATRKKVFIFTLLCHNLCLPLNEHLLMWSQRFNVSPGYLCKL